MYNLPLLLLGYNSSHRHLFHSKNICPFLFPYIYPLPLPHFASIFFAYLWSFRWSNYIVTLPRYFSFRLPHLNIPTGHLSDELDKNSQRTWLSENLSHWNGYTECEKLNWEKKLKKLIAYFCRGQSEISQFWVKY